MLKFLHSLFKQSNANNDHQSIIDTVSEQVSGAGADADEMKAQLHPLTATEQWLDDWGSWFGVMRDPGELDDDYRARVLGIMAEKATIPALTDAAKKILGSDTIVEVYEPFNEIRYFNRSAFSQDGRFEDGDYYRVGVIDLIVNKPITDELQNVINKMKAAGVSCKFTYRP